MRACLIANPHAGADRAPEFIPQIGDVLRPLVRDIEVTISATPDDAQRAAAAAVEARYDAIYVAGGDGTLNAVLRGLPASGSPAIGVIPLGTGNDFAKALDLGDEPIAALDRLAAAQVVEVDLGMLDDRPFANTSAGGFIADVSDHVTETLKNAAGKLAYLLGGARALLGAVPFTLRLHVHDADATVQLPPTLGVQLFAVCNARFIGGGYPIAPDALIDDGRLDALVVPRMPLLEFVAVLQRIAAGDHASDPVIHFRASSFDLEFDRAVRVNTDGEVLDATVCRYRIRPGAVRFFCGPRPQTLRAPSRWDR